MKGFRFESGRRLQLIRGSFPARQYGDRAGFRLAGGLQELSAADRASSASCARCHDGGPLDLHPDRTRVSLFPGACIDEHRCVRLERSDSVDIRVEAKG